MNNELSNLYTDKYAEIWEDLEKPSTQTLLRFESLTVKDLNFLPSFYSQGQGLSQ